MRFSDFHSDLSFPETRMRLGKLLSEKLASISVSVTSGAFGGGAVIDMLASRENSGENRAAGMVCFSDSSEDEEDEEDEDDDDFLRSNRTGDGDRFR